MKVVKKPTHSSIEWQRLRHRDAEGKVIFGASEAPALMGASPYEGKKDLAIRKIGEPTTSDPSPAMISGNLIEPVLIAEASRRLGIEIVTPDFMFAEGRFIATPDGIDKETDDRLRMGEIVAPKVWIEAKTTSRYRVKTHGDIPDLWRWQIAAQQFCTDGIPACYLIVLDADLHISLIEVDRIFEAEIMLIEAAEILGSELDEGKISDEILPLLSSSEISSLWKAEEEAVELPSEAVEWLESMEDAKAMKKQAEEAEEQAKAWIARHLLGASIGTLGGEEVVSWKEQKGRSSFDAKAFAADHPEMFERYTKQGDPFRVMRIRRKKEKRNG